MKTKILIVCSALTFVFNGSSTSLVGYAVFLLLIFLFNKNNKKLPKLLSLRTGVIAVLVFFVLIVILRMQNLFSFIIVDVLNKDLTLHNRTIIWDRTFELIEKKLYTGYGYMSGTSYGELMNNIYFAHPHNYLLYIIFTGGISLLVVIMLGYYLADKNLRKTNRSIYSKVTLFTLLSFFLMGLTESLTGTVFIYPMLIFAMNIDKIIEQDVMDQPWRVDNILIWLKIKAVRKRISFSN
ncbi:MAG: O-antigen ligase family protein [Ruminococcus sp.]|nr:O-antigen ligase family protein [Ruminococcus sp.]MDE7137545.1 O-antigen ligase family protein [Ruminococcus sp.]